MMRRPVQWAALLVAVAAARAAAHPADPPAPKPCAAAEPFAVEALRARVAWFASPALDGRAPGSDGDRAARAAVAEKFECLGLARGGDRDGYVQAFRAGERDTANVVGYLRGTDPDADVIVVGAHLDHLGAQKDGHYLGANDNASGVAALLAIAESLAARAEPPRRTIAFIAFGAEEQGELGSAYFAAHAPKELALARTVYDVNLDMVGSYASRDVVAAMGTFRGTPARAYLDELVRGHGKLHVGLGGRGERSDHEAFCAAGVPYVFFWTPDARCYHAVCDTIANIDAKHLAQIARLAGDLVARLADSDRDLRAAKQKLGCGQK
jgi:hypothetical protein